MKKFPSITIVIPTFNEEVNISRCLESIFQQDYPRKLLEVYIVDNYSTDATRSKVKKFPVKILNNTIADAQVGKMLAFGKAKGELFLYLDADIVLRTTKYLRQMVTPLLEDPMLVGSVSCLCQHPSYTPLNRFLTYDSLQRDPVYEYFSPSIESTIVENRNGYVVCEYQKNAIPPAGRCLYWKAKLMGTAIAKGDRFMELDNLVILVNHGFNRFAYVPNAGEYHFHVNGIKDLIRKRLRNIERNFLPHYRLRRYKWFDIGKPWDLVRIAIWIAYAHLIFPSVIRGVYKTIKYRDWYCLLYEPVLTVVITDVILWGFLKTTIVRLFNKS